MVVYFSLNIMTIFSPKFVLNPIIVTMTAIYVFFTLMLMMDENHDLLTVIAVSSQCMEEIFCLIEISFLLKLFMLNIISNFLGN